jgi:hypothetical protein
VVWLVIWSFLASGSKGQLYNKHISGVESESGAIIEHTYARGLCAMDAPSSTCMHRTTDRCAPTAQVSHASETLYYKSGRFPSGRGITSRVYNYIWESRVGHHRDSTASQDPVTAQIIPPRISFSESSGLIQGSMMVTILYADGMSRPYLTHLLENDNGTAQTSGPRSSWRSTQIT